MMRHEIDDLARKSDDLPWDLCGCTQDLMRFSVDLWGLPWIHGDLIHDLW